MLARQIASCDIPVISAVGHEVDFTIADFVADVRAATPTAAAELITKNQEDIIRSLQQHERRLLQSIKQKIQQNKWQLTSANRALKKPENIIIQARLKIDDAMASIEQKVESKHQSKQTQLTDLIHRLTLNNPETIINTQQQQLAQLSQLLHIRINQKFKEKQSELHDQMLTLHALSPLNTLKRGYSIAKTNDTVITSVTQVKAGDEITTEFEDGHLTSTIK